MNHGKLLGLICLAILAAACMWIVITHSLEDKLDNLEGKETLMVEEEEGQEDQWHEEDQWTRGTPRPGTSMIHVTPYEVMKREWKVELDLTTQVVMTHATDIPTLEIAQTCLEIRKVIIHNILRGHKPQIHWSLMSPHNEARYKIVDITGYKAVTVYSFRKIF